jgi:hypothetical protein
VQVAVGETLPAAERREAGDALADAHRPQLEEAWK